MELLRDYALGSESAFAELVRRHVAFVYSVALRQIGIAAHAEEITQAVFIILARKAADLRENTILEGWLYETTRLASLSFLRGERRRQFREQEAYMQSTLQDSADDAIWTQLAPLLDDAMSRLGKKDRDAVVLRFFKNKSIREIAEAMKMTDAATQRRILRALEKLRKIFMKRGVSSTTAIIAGTISNNSVQAAPVGLAKTISTVAVVKGAAASASTLTLIKGALKIMAWTKMKTAIVVGTVIIFAAGSTSLVIKHQHQVKGAGSGYTTPEAAFQSSLSTMSKSDMKIILANFTPEYMGHFMETVGKGKSDAELAAIFAHDALILKDIQVVSNEAISGNEVMLHFHSARIGNEMVPMKKIGDEWKINGDLTSDTSNNNAR
ncbi:MAG TPA: sigma-70 family RNA polymerase sigma factor [Verrucomicrobiae bacterium]|nr:sigma-70 family RNA polymerase sigma factor [Verrucomicrobiae bacterium]